MAQDGIDLAHRCSETQANNRTLFNRVFENKQRSVTKCPVSLDSTSIGDFRS